MATFADDILKFTQKTEKKFARVVLASVLGVGDKVLEYSPVGIWPKWSRSWQKKRPMPPYKPGLFKGSWDYAFGAPTTEGHNTIDPTGMTSRARFMEVKNSPVVGMHYIFNNTLYNEIAVLGTAKNSRLIKPENYELTVELAAVDWEGIVYDAAKRIAA